MKALAEVIDGHAQSSPHAPAFLGREELTWAQYAARSDRLAAALVQRGLVRGDRVGVLLPDGPGVHIAFVGAEKAGLTVVGIGPRSGPDELRHLLRLTEARALISRAVHRDLDLVSFVAELGGQGLPLRHHLVVQAELGEGDSLFTDTADTVDTPATAAAGGPLSTDDVFLLNSTSGTTGMPKCVIHDQRRWNCFHELAVEAGELRDSDVFLSAIPAPFGFGIWTGHFTPTLLGAPTVLLPQFSADALIDQIDRHRVTVLAAVSTQFIMMLNSPALARHDVSSLRVLFTGGEAVPAERAAEFEDRTGACVLQFYGSNETGALSRTTTRDSRQARLGTAGRVIDGMRVRLFDENGGDVTALGRGQPGCRGPLTSRGYWGDADANAKLHTSDGWMLTGDIATLDSDGYLRVVGRTDDFIIRGGKNVSGPAVEESVSSHAAVALAAAVAMPDPVFGERVCVYVELRPGHQLTLDELVAHLQGRGVSPESFPERLVVVDTLPRSSGEKVAKQALREDIADRIAKEKKQ